MDGGAGLWGLPNRSSAAGRGRPPRDSFPSAGPTSVCRDAKEPAASRGGVQIGVTGGGGGEIRTRGGVAATRLFESRTLNRSDTPPGGHSKALSRARWRATLARFPQLRMLHHLRLPVREVSLKTQRHWGFSQIRRRDVSPWISSRAMDSESRAMAPSTGSPGGDDRVTR